MLPGRLSVLGRHDSKQRTGGARTLGAGYARAGRPPLR